MSEGNVITICWDCRRARALARMRRCQHCLDLMSRRGFPYLPGELYVPLGEDSQELLGRSAAPVIPLHVSNAYYPWKAEGPTNPKIEAEKKRIEELSRRVQHVLDGQPNAWTKLADLLKGKRDT